MLQSESGRKFGNEADWLEIEYFTDPLCCWSWVFEPQWRSFLKEINMPVIWYYRMGGMIMDWKKFRDPLNDVFKPAQIIPYWIQVSRFAGIPVDESIWMKDPPSSSYPACIAVKCAEMQSLETGDIYLQYLREAVMIRCKNIARKEVLMDIAHEVYKSFPLLMDTGRFEQELFGIQSRNLFKQDLQNLSVLGIERFPSLLMRKPGKNGLIITGYRPSSFLLEAAEELNSVKTR